MSSIEPPILTVENDYNDYFRSIVQSWVDTKKADGHIFKTSNIIVNSGPWRSYDVSWDAKTPGTLKLDFYSVCRTRGGVDYPLELDNII